jgi:hypothetical protein
MRQAPRPVSFTDYDVKLPERELLRSKIGKSYETNGIPLELVLYYDNTSWLVGDVPVVADFSYHAQHVMKPLIDPQTTFRRVWVFDRHRHEVLWNHSAATA